MIGALDIFALQAAYADGSMTPRTVIQDVYARIAKLGERPIWISLRTEQAALAAADQAPKGPLYGIPFAVKDNIDVAGLPTTCGCPAFAYTPERSATVVELLEAAGAIVIGKTNLDQFATGLVGTRSPYGVPTSPFNAAYISGGSSSGSAVAVARGLVSFALGTDTAGSGRVPAGFNNIVGLKPTKGMISTRGVVPACRSQDTVSIFALTVTDALTIAKSAASFDPADIYARRPPHPITVPPLASGVRIGVPDRGLDFLGDAAAEQNFAEAIEAVRELGAYIVPFNFTPFADAARLLYAGPWVAERYAAVGAFSERHCADMDATVATIIEGARSKSAADAFDGFYALATFMRETEHIWETFDAMMVPTTVTTYKIADVQADPVHLNSNLGATTNFVNLMDLSALAVPAGFRGDGLPAGVTLIGRAFEDGRLAAIGDALHRGRTDATLGATKALLAATPSLRPDSVSTEKIAVAVVGAHLTGQPLNSQLRERGATFVRTTRTAAGYSFYALPGSTPAKPGLIFDGTGNGLIEVEIWQMDYAAFGSFVGLIPPPLGIGTIALTDGSSVKGFLCEAHAVRSARDITAFGSWRNWLAASPNG